MMEAHDRLYVEQAQLRATIPIDTLGVQTTQFSIDDDPDLKHRLYQSGRDAAAEFLKTWDFDAYIKTFRQGDQPTRRERVTAAMKAHASMIANASARRLRAGGLDRRPGLQQLRPPRRPRRRPARSSTPPSKRASRSSTPPTSTAAGRARSTSARCSRDAATRWCWPPSSGWTWATAGGRAARASTSCKAIEASLRRLRTDTIDYYWYHRPDGVDADRRDARGAPRARPARARCARSAPPTSPPSSSRRRTPWPRERGLTPFTAVQNEYSLLVRDAERDVLPGLRAAGHRLRPVLPARLGPADRQVPARRGRRRRDARLSGRDEIATDRAVRSARGAPGLRRRARRAR